MVISEYIPGMKPGNTGRNVGVGLVYLFLLPLILGLSLFIIPILIGKNYNGIATKLDSIPGINSAGGVASGIVSFFILFALFGLISAVAPVSDENIESTNGEDLDANSQGTSQATDTPISGTNNERTDTPARKSPTQIQVVNMDSARMVVESKAGFTGSYGSKINQKNNHGEYKNLVLSVGAGGGGPGDDDYNIGRYKSDTTWEVVAPDNTGYNVNIRAPVYVRATAEEDSSLTLSLYIDGQMVGQDTASDGEEAVVKYEPNSS